MSPAELAQSLKADAAKLGFEFSAACPAVSPFGAQSLWEWIDAGYAGQMNYFQTRREAYAEPQRVMAGAMSLLMLGTRYQGMPKRRPQAGWGRVASYASGLMDYHDLIHTRLKQLGAAAEQRVPGVRWRGVVDTAPLLEREFAALAGMGWQAKNTMLIHPQEGSYFFLSALLLDVELDFDQPMTTDHCGTCRRCLDACPTNAFVSERVLDATKCISYLTIELREPIPVSLRPAMEDWIFGCDVCQDVCPWNRFAKVPESVDFQVAEEVATLDLNQLLLMDDDAFRARFRRTPMWRAKRRGLLRNVAIAMGNQRLPEFLPALFRAVHDAEPLVRGAVAWALGQYGDPNITAILQARLEGEDDASVREELLAALQFSAHSVGSDEPEGLTSESKSLETQAEQRAQDA